MRARQGSSFYEPASFVSDDAQDLAEALVKDCPPVSEWDARTGKHISPSIGISSDSVGWLVPAVPSRADDAFWGYTSIPPDAVEWWHSLPL